MLPQPVETTSIVESYLYRGLILDRASFDAASGSLLECGKLVHRVAAVSSEVSQPC